MEPTHSPAGTDAYFPLDLQLNAAAWELLGPDPEIFREPGPSRLYRLRLLADRLRRQQPAAPGAGQLNLLTLLNRVLRLLARRYLADRGLQVAEDGLVLASGATALGGTGRLLAAAVESHPPQAVHQGESPADFLRQSRRREQTLVELLVLSVQTVNPAAAGFRELFDDAGLVSRIDYRSILTAADRALADEPAGGPIGGSLLARLLEPIHRHPGSLAEQLRFVRESWAEWLPAEMLEELLTGLDVAAEEEQVRGFGPGPALPPGLGGAAGEPEAFSPDVDWMPRVVLMAKTIYVWLDQLSRHYGREISRLDQIPDRELDKLAGWGFTSLWLIGIWERSPASQRIKRIMGNPEAVSSAYSLYDYVVAADLGGDEALDQLRGRCVERGIRLACDVVPNHTGIYSRWVRENPDWFIQAEYPPYPAYRFTGPDLSDDPDLGLFIEDGYWSHSDAAVVFRHEEKRSGRVRYIYHGNDGTHMPWNDTAQLNYLLPKVREAVIRTVIEVARRFPVIRFDAAMTLAKKHFQRLWFPRPGAGAGVPSRSEHAMSAEDFERAFPQEFWRELVDRVAAEVPDTLLLAEAFWLMEGYFVRTLGMHRVYNSAFMNMLKQEENAKYRRVIQEILEFNPEILKRFVNFMNNPDEATAVEQFGKADKYFGTAVLLATLPGLPMFGHGQFEGLREKYGMEYRRAYWEEEPDEAFVRHHEAQICPLLRRRYLFSEVAGFQLFDFLEGEGVNEDVFAYANSCGEERALVVYHNRAAQAAGRLMRSTPRVAAEGEQPVRATLGEALGLDVGPDRFWRFREHRGGLEYLADGGELREQGLELRLGPYDYRVFLEFREVRDEDGCWAELHRRLQGRGVPSLERELAAIRFRELREAAGRLLDRESLRELALTLERPPGEPLPGGFRERLEAFLEELARATGAGGKSRDLATVILADLVRLGELLARGRRPRGPLPLRELAALWRETDAEGNRPAPAAAALLAALVLGRIGELTGPGQAGERSADWIDRFLLSDALFPGQAATAALVLAGVRFASFWDPLAGREDPEALLADGAVQELLQVHWAGGKRWFNRERWDLLTRQLAWLGSLEALAGDRKGWERRTEEVGRERAAALVRAENAGYQVEPLVRAWQQEQREKRSLRVEERLGEGRRRILFVAPEATPFAKTGGLADVAGALPRELHRQGHDVRLVLPGYAAALARGPELEPGPELEVPIGGRRLRGRLLLGAWEGLPVAFVEQEELFGRPGLYGEAGEDYPDNAERFGFFARAVLQGTRLWDFRPDVIHLHDWQTALVAVLLRTERRHDPFFAATASLLTLHNLGYQGLFPPAVLEPLGLDRGLFNLDQLEFYGHLSFLKGGVVHADLLNTVSPTYCREIRTPEMGMGFEGILASREEDLHGILNGIDPGSWNPGADPALARPYGPGDLEGKAVNKDALQRELGLEVDSRAPLAALVTRIDRQKGLDLVAAAWEELVARGLQLVVLGTGERAQMERLAELNRRSPGRSAVRLEFDDDLSRRIYAGSDLFLMPSRYEPCGLGQLIALRYGSVPVVRGTGGLVDTVVDPREDPETADGFRFEEPSVASLLQGVDRALATFRQPSAWRRLVRRGMEQDFSWSRSAGRYLELYRKALEKRL